MEDQHRDYDDYAGFWLRFVAYLIDGIILNIIVYFMMFIMGIFTLGPIMSMGEEPSVGELFSLGSKFFSMIMLAIIASWLYYALQEASVHQATLGKRVLRLYVIMENGERVNFTQASIRYFGKILSGLIFMVGYIMAGFTEKKQALHDMIARTLVMKQS